MPPLVLDYSSKTCETISNSIIVSKCATNLNPFLLTQARLELARRAGNEPPLVGLIRVYKDYYPDVIVGQLTAGRASVFTVNVKGALPK